MRIWEDSNIALRENTTLTWDPKRKWAIVKAEKVQIAYGQMRTIQQVVYKKWQEEEDRRRDAKWNGMNVEVKKHIE
jgi:hypothetical protein